MANPTHTEVLNEAYSEAKHRLSQNNRKATTDKLRPSENKWLEIISTGVSKSAVAVVVTSLTHKVFNPSQDVRLHQNKMDGGYSGRGIDTKYITPFLRKKDFPCMASGSGWLTRSFEQSVPYYLDYKGAIDPEEVKSAFLHILDNIETKGRNPNELLIYLFQLLIIQRDSKVIKLAKPTNIPISIILNFLHTHFTHPYSVRGASRLPVLALYSVYECMIHEMSRFSNKTLMPLMEHTVADRHSGYIGDIDIKDKNDRLFESVEVKHGIKITKELVIESYEKFKEHPVKRYYILSTAGIKQDEIEEINKQINKILRLHGCQVIVNGIMESLKYYLRVLHDPNEFINRYVENLKRDNSIKFEHRDMWNKIVGGEI